MLEFLGNPTKKLLKAAQQGDIDAVRALLAAGADPNGSNRRGDTPFVLAYQAGYRDISLFLLEQGAELSEGLSQAVLMKELHSGRSELPKALISRGFEVNRTNKVGSSPLLLASLYGLEEIVRLLLSAGADVNHKDEDGTTSLIAAAAKGHSKIVEILLENGAEKSATNTAGMSAETQAIKNGHPEVTELLRG